MRAYINRKPIKQIDFTSNIFRFLGIYLLNKTYLFERLNDKYVHSNIKNKFVIASIEDKFKIKLLKEINNETKDIDDIYFHLINFIYNEKTEYPSTHVIRLIQSQSIDIVDLFLLEEIEIISINKQKISYLNLTSTEVIISILRNFSNAIQKITKNRRKDHTVFNIKDEYDVQDILYTILKAVFPKIKIEEPTPSVGIGYNKIDFILEGEGILIEVKMMKENDKDEKKFIDELKVDIQSYYKKENTKYLICFIYDPYKKTKDVQNYFQLDTKQIINGKELEVKVVVAH